MASHHHGTPFTPMTLALVCLCCAWAGSGWALENRSISETQQEPEHVGAPIHHMTIATKDLLQTLAFSRQDELTEKVTRTRANPSDTVGERVFYRYDPQGKITGEYIGLRCWMDPFSIVRIRPSRQTGR